MATTIKKLSQHTLRFKLLLLSFFFNIVIIGFVIRLYLVPIQPNYYATSVNGITQKLTALDEPNTSDSVITQWAELVAVAAYSYDFVNYNEQLNNLENYFTDEAWSNFTQIMRASNTVDQVVSKKLIVNAVAIEPPVILAKGELYGVFSWRIQIPILVTYQAARGFYSQKILVNLLVSRISTLQSVNGIGIAQFSSGPFYDTVTKEI